MDKETALKYSPIAIVVIALIFQWNLFVTPEKHEIMRREIMTYVNQNYVTRSEFTTQQEDMKEIKMKLDKIYDFIILGKK